MCLILVVNLRVILPNVENSEPATVNTCTTFNTSHYTFAHGYVHSTGKKAITQLHELQ